MDASSSIEISKIDPYQSHILYVLIVPLPASLPGLPLPILNGPLPDTPWVVLWAVHTVWRTESTKKSIRIECLKLWAESNLAPVSNFEQWSNLLSCGAPHWSAWEGPDQVVSQCCPLFPRWHPSRRRIQCASFGVLGGDVLPRSVQSTPHFVLALSFSIRGFV